MSLTVSNVKSAGVRFNLGELGAESACTVLYEAEVEPTGALPQDPQVIADALTAAVSDHMAATDSRFGQDPGILGSAGSDSVAPMRGSSFGLWEFVELTVEPTGTNSSPWIYTIAAVYRMRQPAVTQLGVFRHDVVRADAPIRSSVNVYQPVLYRDGADAPTVSNTQLYSSGGAFIDIGGTSIDGGAAVFPPSAWKLEITVTEPLSTLNTRTYPLPAPAAAASRFLKRNSTPIFGFGVGEVAYLGASLVQTSGSKYAREHLFVADPFFSHHVQRAAVDVRGEPIVETVNVGGQAYAVAKYVSWWQVYSLDTFELRDAIDDATVKEVWIGGIAEDAFSEAP